MKLNVFRWFSDVSRRLEDLESRIDDITPKQDRIGFHHIDRNEMEEQWDNTGAVEPMKWEYW